MNRALALGLLLALVTVTSAAGCGAGHSENGSASIRIVASISIIADLVENVAGDRAVVEYLVPRTENPEDYEPIPSDFQKVCDADIFFVNGWQLEGWLEGVIANISEARVVRLVDGVTDPIPLLDGRGNDPHAWFDVERTMQYVDLIVDSLVDLDPDGREVYAQNARDYHQQLEELHEWILAQVRPIPPGRRVLILSENCLKYYGDAYGFETHGIWDLNASEEGTPQQIADTINLVGARDVPALFLESTVPSRYLETVSAESGVPIAALIYTDALGEEGSGADTYIGMMRHNTRAFVDGLLGR